MNPTVVCAHSKLPHIHVKYQEHEVIVSIPDGDVLDGSIPNSKMKLLQAWIELHKDELVADWELAVITLHAQCHGWPGLVGRTMS